MRKQPIVVIKLGTSSIVHEKTHQPLLSTLSLIVETAVSLRRDGYRVVLVSSGAIGLALQKTGQSRRPKHLAQVQALAAIGQCRLMGLWEEMFERLGQGIGQILLTRNDISDRTQYLNAKNTLDELLNMGFIPIVNENDTIAVSEIKFGDNDTLSAITAGMIGADYLFLMTDVDCLYDANPRTHPDAKPIEVVENILELAVDVSSAGSSLGTGGMSTKIVAARLATAAGVTTIVTRSSLPGNIAAITTYLEVKKAEQRVSLGSSKDTPNPAHVSLTVAPPLHTRFLPSGHRVRDRHFWLLHGLSPHGTIYVDHGAAKAISEGRGLLPVGIIQVAGSFAQQECVRIVEASRSHPEAQSLYKPNHLSEPSQSPGSATPSRPPTHRSQSSLTSLTVTANPPIDFPTPGSLPNSSTSTPSPSSSQLLYPRSITSTGTSGTSEREIGRALVNYSAIEIKRIAGLQSTQIAGVLGYADTEYVAFRENVALFLETRASVGSSGEKVEQDREAGSTGVASDADGVGNEGRESGTSTPVPGTPSAGRVHMGLGGYVEG